MVLALIDSSSFGTLLIPVWLLLTPGPLNPRRILLYLAVVAVFYLLLGLGLLAGATSLLDALARTLDSRPVRILQLVVGMGLLVTGAVMEPLTKAGKEKAAARRADRRKETGPGRLGQWRARATDGSASVWSIAGLAVTAAAIEAASMLPYLAAIGLLATSDLSFIAKSATLGVYCLVMILPAVLLLTVRLALNEKISPFLTRLESWLTRNARETVAWVMAIIGLYLIAGAAPELGLGGG